MFFVINVLGSTTAGQDERIVAVFALVRVWLCITFQSSGKLTQPVTQNLRQYAVLIELGLKLPKFCRAVACTHPQRKSLDVIERRSTFQFGLRGWLTVTLTQKSAVEERWIRSSIIRKFCNVNITSLKFRKRLPACYCLLIAVHWPELFK